MSTIFDGTPDWPDLVAALGLVLAVAYVVAIVAGRLVRRAVLFVLGDTPSAGALPSVRQPIRAVEIGIFVVTAAGLALPALELAGVPLRPRMQADVLFDWLLGSGLRVVLIAVGAFVIARLVNVVVQRFEHELTQGTDLEMLERAKRARTLGGLIRGTVLVLIATMAGLMILRELRVDIMPVLTGAGIAGIAVGFGAQTLVRDVIAGFFLILENQVRVGDVAVVNGTGGLVEQITLRTIVLRDFEGAVHIFPNGAITTMTNRTRDFSYALLDVGVAYREDTDVVSAVLREVGEAIRQDPQFGPQIIGPLEVVGVEAFQDSQVVIRVRMKTIPLKQWDTARELRRRIKKAFEARGIEIPFRHVTVILREGRAPASTTQP
jgi:small-conductance mechanosensitive channel